MLWQRLRTNRHVVVALFGAVAALQFLDVFTTSLMLQAGGVELNPWAAWILQHFGIMGLVLQKVVAIAAVGAVFYAGAAFVKRTHPRALEATYGVYAGALVALAAWFVVVAVNNVAVAVAA